VNSQEMSGLLYYALTVLRTVNAVLFNQQQELLIVCIDM